MALFGPPNIEKLESKRNVSGLIRALRYKKTDDVRKDAAKALGRLGDVRAVKPLCAALRDSECPVRVRAAEALGSIGDAKAVEPLLAALKDHNNICRNEEIVEALGRIGDARAVEPLVAALKDHNNICRNEEIVEALGRIGDARAVEPLVTALKDHNDRYTNEKIVEALGRIGGARAVEALVAALTNSDAYERRTAADALDKLGWRADGTEAEAAYCIARERWERCVDIGRPAVGPLVAILRDGSACEAVFRVLRAIGKPAVEPLVDATLRGTDRVVRRAAAEALGSIGETRALESLLRVVSDEKEPEVRRAAAIALREFDDPRARSAVKEADSLIKEDAKLEKMEHIEELKRLSGTVRAKHRAEELYMSYDFVVCPDCYTYLGTRKELKKSARRITQSMREKAAQSRIDIIADAVYKCPKCGAEVLL